MVISDPTREYVLRRAMWFHYCVSRASYLTRDEKTGQTPNTDIDMDVLCRSRRYISQHMPKFVNIARLPKRVFVGTKSTSCMAVNNVESIDATGVSAPKGTTAKVLFLFTIIASKYFIFH